MTPHTAVGIAQVAVYTPVTLYAQYIGIRCWKYGSRMACYMVMAFTLIRLAGGALLITVEKDLSSDNAEMIKVTYILLNLGIVPLLASFDGFLGLVFREDYPNNTALRLIHYICASLIILATALLITAGTMTGKIDQASLQGILYKIGYFDFLAVFLVVVLLSLWIFLTQHDSVKSTHFQIIIWLLLSSPFLAVRAAYGTIGIFEATGPRMFTSMWSSLFGSATALSLMALLPEFIVICIYIHILRSRVKACKHASRHSDSSNGDLIENGNELDSRRKHRRRHSSKHRRRH
ncbi:hypothetical protein ACN47E_004894 [Coniothyrium glycines]